MSVIYHAVLSDGRLAVGCHFDHADDALDTGAAACISVGQIGFAVLVPEGAGVDDAFGGIDEHEGFPRTGGIFGLGHEDAQVGVAVVDVKLSVVIAYGRSPDGVAVVGGGKFGIVGHNFDGVADYGPVYEVFGVRGCRRSSMQSCNNHRLRALRQGRNSRRQ